MKKSLIALFAATILYTSGTEPAVAEDFTVIALPDTQNYSEHYPEIYTSQTQWIVDSANTLNTQFVTHLGDIVNNAATAFEWANAVNAMDILDNADMPYGTCVGNHDIHYPGDYYDPDGENYLTRFSPDNYADKSWFGGASPSGLSNYQIVTVDGKGYLFMHILVETPPQELAWAQEILNDNQDKPTWVSTHRYLFNWSILGAGRYDDFNYTFEGAYRDDGIPADSFYHNFVAANRQIYMVYCGHNHAEYRQTSTNNFGLTVHEVLADYQDGDNGGDGYLRINTIKPDDDRIDVKTYSSYRNSYETDGDSQFTLSVNFDDYTSNSPVLSFRQGVDGYAGAVDTYVSENNSGASYGSSGTVVVDNDTENSLWGDDEAQGLLKFGDIFQGAVLEGDDPPTRIPLGATITNAVMTITLVDDVDSPSCSGLDFNVHRLARDWNESSTWNSLGSGISTGSSSEVDTTILGSFAGDNDPDSDYSRTVDVTSAVRDWSNGSANYGFVITSEDISWCDDGVEIKSSNNSSTAERPMLTVSFTYTVTNVEPTVTQVLTAAPAQVNEGEESILTLAAEDPNAQDPLIFWLEGQEIGYATGSGSVEHAVLFEDEGTYTFSARIEDDEAIVDAGTVTVVVNNLPPVITDLTSDLTVDAGRIFTYAVQASDPGVYDTITTAWDLDDNGAYDDDEGTEGTAWFSTTGEHIVRVKVEDNDGAETVDEFIVTVVDIAADGDFDNDGDSVDTTTHVFTDADDETAFEFCMAGSGVTPAPPAPYDAVNCLSAFDADNDGDVDSDDENDLLGIETVTPVPAIGIAGLLLTALIILAIGVYGLDRRTGKQ
nr:DNRLRE domain-containing protein [uncultured Desulfobacter sp.]